MVRPLDYLVQRSPGAAAAARLLSLEGVTPGLQLLKWPAGIEKKLDTRHTSLAVLPRGARLLDI
jgi:hypothetical protein